MLWKAIFASAPDLAPGVLLGLIEHKTFATLPAAISNPVLTDFARLTAARGDTAEIAKVLGTLAEDPTPATFAIVKCMPSIQPFLDRLRAAYRNEESEIFTPVYPPELDHFSVA